MDEWRPAGAGLFQLHQDGASTPVTSYVDRALLRSEQLDQLGNAIGWLPEQVIAAAYEQIMENKYHVPESIGQPSTGTLFAPTPVKLAVILAPGEAESGHPLRPYFWPKLAGDGSLILEHGEQLLQRDRVAAPSTMSYAEDVFTHLTTHRFATTAKLSLPIDQRGDYKLSLGLVSPTLMEGFAALRQLGRIGQNKNRRWVQHYRYEWLTNVTKLTTTTAKKKLFGGRRPEHISTWFRGEVRWPNGKSGYVDLWSLP